MIRERVIDGMMQSRREELKDLNADIAARQQQIDRLNSALIDRKRAKYELLRSINGGVTDRQIADVLTGVMVGEGVISDEHSGWFEDCELDSNGTA
jgi:hypothetical protein